MQGFLIRAYILPDEEYNCLKTNLMGSNTSLGELMLQWEKAYEELFGTEEMVYNVHLWTHAEIIRKQGALPLRSAFPFEGLYSDFKKKYADGTFNKPKQVQYFSWEQNTYKYGA